MMPGQAHKIKLLIITSRPDELGSVAVFLNKRDFDVKLISGLREGMAFLGKLKPDWVFLSINLSPAIDKYVEFLKRSFGLEPILFADSFDRVSMTRLEQSTSPIINSKLTGPSIQLRLHRLLTEGSRTGIARFRQPPRATSGVKRSSFVHMKGGETPTPSAGTVTIKMNPALEGKSPVRQEAPALVQRSAPVPPQGKAADFSSDTPQGQVPLALTAAEAKLYTNMKMMAQALGAKPEPPTFRPVQGVEEISVMVWEDGSYCGYLVMGGSFAGSMLESEKVYKTMDAVHRNRVGIKEKLFGAIKMKIDDLPSWASLRSKLVQKHVAGGGEILTCFIPHDEPLPAMLPSPADPEKVEVRLQDIPTHVALPCAIFIHLPQNSKFVCLIKADGQLSSIQQDRLLKMGASNLVIAKEDVRRFCLIYVREKLSSVPAEIKLSA